MKYYRIIDNVLESDPFELSGTDGIAMAGTTTDGRDQYLLAQAVVDLLDPDAFAALGITDARGV